MMIDHAKAALARNFFIFALRPRDKRPFDKRSFNGALGPSDPVAALMPWRAQPLCDIGIDLGRSNLIVFDVDKPEYIPPWLNATRTYKVKTARGVQYYFTGTLPHGMNLYIGGVHVGEVRSTGQYVVAAGSVHLDGPIYTVIDSSPVAPMPPEAVALLNASAKAQAASNAQPIDASPEGPPIPYGQHYNTLFRMAAGLRGKGHDQGQIEPLLIDVCLKRCVEYGADYRVMCRDIAASVMRYPTNAQRARDCAFPGVSPHRIACTHCHDTSK